MFCDLSNKTILISGATSALGRDCAQLLSELGANLCLLGRDTDKLNDLKNSLHTGSHQVFTCDLCDFDCYGDLFKQIKAEAAPLDGFIHFAGELSVKPLKVLSADAASQTTDVNYLSFTMLTKFFTKKGICHPDGAAVVAISSVSSQKGSPGLLAYAASKAALESAVRSLACEFAAKKIRFNAVSPGRIEVGLGMSIKEQLPEAVYDAVSERHPLGLGQPRDLSNLIVFLLSNESRWLTGANIPLDGGFSIS